MPGATRKRVKRRASGLRSWCWWMGSKLVCTDHDEGPCHNAIAEQRDKRTAGKNGFIDRDLFIAPGPKSAEFDEELTTIARQLNSIISRAAELAAKRERTGFTLITLARGGFGLRWGPTLQEQADLAKAIKARKARKCDCSEQELRKHFDF